MLPRERKEPLPDTTVPTSPSAPLTYREAGVDIAAAEEAVRLIKAEVESTYIPGVLGALGGFAGLYELPRGLEDPVLVTSTDGVGTKLILAQQAGRLDTVGVDLVAMSVNDVLTVGARPVLFLDYVAVGRLAPEDMARIVAGVAAGCREAGCALVGGEMAEMPGLYAPGEFDLAGFCVGLAERKRLVDGSAVREGDVVLGLAASGFHSNGYSLLRRVLDKEGLSLTDPFPLTQSSVADVVLRPTRIYVRSVLRLLEQGAPVGAMAHITGGGMAGNLSRVIPSGLSARLCFAEWEVPALFKAVQDLGNVAPEEMFATFNMGIGYVVVVPQEAVADATRVLKESGEEVIRLGSVVRGEPRVVLEGIG